MSIAGPGGGGGLPGGSSRGSLAGGGPLDSGSAAITFRPGGAPFAGAAGTQFSLPGNPFINSGVLLVPAGVTLSTSIVNTSQGQIIISGQGVTTFAGSLTNQGVVQTPTGSNTVVDTVRGTGSFTGGGIVTVRNLLAPGNSPGQQTFTNLTLESTSTTQMQLHRDFNTSDPPFTPGTDYDQTVITGTTPGSLTINSGAKLELVLLPGYSPQHGDTFVIFRNTGGAPVTGTFTNVDGTPLPEGALFTAAGATWNISYTTFGGGGYDVVVRAAPEPASLMLLGTVAASAAGGWWWRRRSASHAG
jgi:hypothetical protein